MTCVKCGFQNVNDASQCPRCSGASASFDSESKAGASISQDFLLGNAKVGLERIRTRLLDLTNRNRLLNFRHSPRSSLSLVGVLPDTLFETLIEGYSVTFKSVPEPDTAGPRPKVVDHARQIGLPVSVDLPERGSLPAVRGGRAGNVQTLHYPKDLEAVLRRISYIARTAIEESGTRVLHLIFGFLEWFDSDHSNQPHLAPLLLVPVTIEKGNTDRTTGTFTYEIAYFAADQIEENPSLREKLKQDFGLDLPELPDEETPERYFLKFRRILATKPRWRLRRRVTLGFANFGKLLMFKDLNPTNWPKEADLIEHPLIRDFFEGSKQSESSFAEEYLIDAPDLQERVPALIHDADSSQHSALIDALEGKNLVIQGAPGTGKSQTITNLIALALANGKTVLFVSKKLAALEVVRRRLDQAGLGLFCLELHSHKTDKRKLLDELEEGLAARDSHKGPQDIDLLVAEKKARLQSAKQELIEYADLINMPFSALGCTAFDLISRRERLRQQLAFEPGLVDKIVLDRDHDARLTDFDSNCAILEVYGRQLAELRKSFPDIESHPWRHVSNVVLDSSGEQELQRKLEEIISGARQMRTTSERLGSMIGAASEAFASREAVAGLIAKANEIPDAKNSITKALLTTMTNARRESDLVSFIHDVTAWRTSRAELNQQFPETVRGIDMDGIEPLRLACEEAVEFGLGNFDLTMLRNLVTECEYFRAALKRTSVLNRESLASDLSTCESATGFSSLLDPSYRRTRRAFEETFFSPNQPQRKDMVETLRRSLDFVDKLGADEDFRTRHQTAALSYDDFGILIETSRLIVSFFERFAVGEGRNARDVLAAISQFSANCKMALAIAKYHPARDLIGVHFQGVSTDLQVVSSAIDEIEAIRRADVPEVIRSWLLQSDTDARLSLLRIGLTSLGKQLSALDHAVFRFSELSQIDLQAWSGRKPWTFAMLEQAATAALEEIDSLSSWLEFQRASRDVKSAKLEDITKLAETKVIEIADLVPAYAYVFYNTLAQKLAKEQPLLLQCSGLRLEAVRERFVRFDKELIELNRQAAAVLTRQRPVPAGILSSPVGTELALIEQEIAKKKRTHPNSSTHSAGWRRPASSEAVLHDGTALCRSVPCARPLEI